MESYNHPNIRVLFIGKQRPMHYGASYGLYNSCLFICNALRQLDVDCKVVMVHDNNCLHSSTKITTEDGVKSIVNIIRNKYSGKVLSLNTNGQFEWNRVINWWEKSNKELKKRWINIITKPKSKLVCTEDHRCAIVDNPLYPRVYYLPAKDIKGKFLVKNPRNRTNFNVNPLFNREQISILLGIMMGDGHIDTRNVFSCGHSIKQLEYIKLKQLIFSGKISKEHVNPWGTTIHCTFPVNAQTQCLRKIFYPVGIKNVENVLSYLDELSLAFWYMDDGCLVNCDYKNSRPHLRLCTHSYTHLEHELMIDFFTKKWGITPVISRQKQNNKEYEFLEFHKDDSEKFWTMISPYIPDCMQYKIPEKFRVPFTHSFNTNFLGYAATEVLEIKINEYNQRGKLYDIEVENVHNFVANEVVVHNCIDKEVHDYKPTHVFIEAIWVVPEKFNVLIPLHPKVNWYVRLHSNTPFLSGEGNAIDWIKRYNLISKKYPKFKIASNAKKLINDLHKSLDIDMVYAPNIYCLGSHNNEYSDSNSKSDNIIRIGGFGSLRQLKNQLIQAMAAIVFANKINKKLEFHINHSPIEVQGDPIYKNIVHLFKDSKHKLFIHDWHPHDQFLKLVKSMDLGLQVSMSETFNIICADFVDLKIPIVGSAEIEWMSSLYKAIPTDLNDIVNHLCIAWRGRHINLQKLNNIGLNSHNKNAKNSWHKLLSLCN